MDKDGLRTRFRRDAEHISLTPEFRRRLSLRRRTSNAPRIRVLVVATIAGAVALGGVALSVVPTGHHQRGASSADAGASRDEALGDARPPASERGTTATPRASERPTSPSTTTDAAPVASAQPAPAVLGPPPASPRPIGTVPPTAEPGKSGVDGDLVGNPSCRQATPPCEAMSPLLSGTVWAQQNGRTVATTHTSSANNQFTLPLPRGDYTIYAKPDDYKDYPSCTPVGVSVPEGQYVSVRIECQGK
jgi:hypothetical protein